MISNESFNPIPLILNAEDENYFIQEWIKGHDDTTYNQEVKRIFREMLRCLQGEIDKIDTSYLEKLHINFNMITPFIKSTECKSFFHQLFMCVYLNYIGANEIQNISKALSLLYSLNTKNDLPENVYENVIIGEKINKETAKKIITNLQNKISLDPNILSAQKNDAEEQEKLFSLYTNPKIFNIEAVLHEIIMGIILPCQQFKSLIIEFQEISPITYNLIENEYKNMSVNLTENIKYLRQTVLHIVLPDRFKVPDADNIHSLDILLNHVFDKNISLIYKVDTLLSFRSFINCQSLEDLFRVIHQEEKQNIIPTTTIEFRFLALLKNTICAVVWIYFFLKANKSFLLSMSTGDFINSLQENTIYIFNNKFYIYFQDKQLQSTCYRTLVYQYVKHTTDSYSVSHGTIHHSSVEH